MEPLITNCLADHITARSIAYIRTKMTKLRDETILSGQAGLKHPDVLHESHTQSTDAPQMPPPSTAPDGSGDVVRISRYCERLVQQAVRHIHDNSVIAECFEVAPHIDAGGVPGQKANKFANCCPRRCCGMKGNPNESISNLTFFTEEDAISLQEMCDHMPAPSPSKQKMREIAPRPPAGDAATSDIRLNNLESEVQEEQSSIPLPSAKPKKSSLKKFSLKNMRKSPTKKVHESRPEIQEEENRRHRIRGLRVLPSLINKGKNRTDVEEAKSPPKREKNKKGVRFQDETKKKKASVKDRSSAKENLQKTREKAQKDDNESRKVLKKYRERTRKSKSLPSAPFPSVRSDVFYDPVADDMPNYDWTSAKSDFPEPPDKEALPQSAPFKGNAVKMCVFGFLLLLQLGEIYFVTNVKMEDNKFFIRNIDDSPGPGASRMNCALLSCILAAIWYPLFTIHVIALLSYLVEYIRLQVSGDDEPYEETDSPTTSRHSLAALP